MKKTSTLIISVLSLLVGLQTGWAKDVAKTAAKTNVLFIICDDLNTDLGTYGHPQVKSPNIDRLAAQGTRFNNAYAQWPGCLPSRYSFLSGWSIPRIGVRDFSFKARTGNLAEAVYLPEWFKQNGYTTIRVDKVFHPGGDDKQSWTVSEEPIQLTGGRMLINWLGIELQTLGLDGVHDFYRGAEDGWGSPVMEKDSFPNVEGEKGTYFILHDTVPEEMLFDGNTAERGKMYLEQFAESGEPFFMALGFRRPHLPFIAHQRYYDMYPTEDIQLPPPQPGYTKPFSDTDHQRLIRGYYASISFVDAQVGKVLNKLKETGLDKSTVVVLIGDHGYALGERDGWFSKGKFWDLSLRTTCIIVTPESMRKDVESNQVVSLTDLYPTLVDLAGLPTPPTPLDGNSLASLVTQGDASGLPNAAISHNFRPNWSGVTGSIRTAQWRYMELGDGTRELYDAVNDPFHWRNLVDDPTYASIVAELSARVAAASKME